MESEQNWPPLYYKEKRRVHTKMAETYCYLLFGLFFYFDGTFSIFFLSRQMRGSALTCLVNDSALM
ncbi:hypothetical protein NC651_004317 [Populus alba x Populus x berolinensis]|nr:hypothetical protein NC651_004317 [Populus alba x Populus x berolinensis]